MWGSGFRIQGSVDLNGGKEKDFALGEDDSGQTVAGFMASGFGFQTQKLRISNPGILNSGVWCMVHGVWCMVYGVWCMVYGVWYMVYDAWFRVYGVLCFVYCVLCIVYGVWCAVHGV